MVDPHLLVVVLWTVIWYRRGTIGGGRLILAGIVWIWWVYRIIKGWIRLT